MKVPTKTDTKLKWMQYADYLEQQSVDASIDAGIPLQGEFEFNSVQHIYNTLCQVARTQQSAHNASGLQLIYENGDQIFTVEII